MMCAVMLKPHSHEQRHGRVYNLIEGFLNGLTYSYKHSLDRALRAWPLVLAVLLGAFVLCAWLFGGLRSELAPTEDTGTIVGVFNGPDGATIGLHRRATPVRSRPLTRAFRRLIATWSLRVSDGRPGHFLHEAGGLERAFA